MKNNRPQLNRFNNGIKATYTDVIKVKTESNGLGTIKTLIIFGITALQLAFFLIFHYGLMLAYKWLIIGTFFISLFTCIYVISSKKNSQSKALWIIFLLLFFPFAYVFYFLSDERILMSGAKRKYANICKDSAQIQNQELVEWAEKSVKNDCEYLMRAGGFSAYKNTNAKYFSSGYLLYEDLIEKLKSAKEFIFIEFFIIADGNLLNRMLDVLTGKVKSGVEVRVIYDDMGSHRVLSKKTKKRLALSGIKLLAFNKVLPIVSVGINYRDHRKIVIIDGQTAYTGGCNLADEYVNEKRLHGYWKDSSVRLSGKATDTFTLAFLRQWEFLTKKKEDYSVYLSKAKDNDGDGIIVPFVDGLDYEQSIGKGVYESIISGATERIFIMTPYFIVDETLANMLKLKAMSGVDVRLILPEIADKKLVYGVTRNNAEKLIDYGVKVYCMKNSFVHSKVVLTENSAVVGSINMDLRSFYQQFESAVYISDKEVMSQVLADFEQTIENSKMLSEKNRLRNHTIYRMFAGVMQLFAPFM